MILIVDNHSKNVPRIEKILEKLDQKYVTRDQKSLQKTLEKDHFQGIILSGGLPLLDEEINFSAIRADISCLINYDMPILGICVGHEIIGAACGAELIKLKEHAWMPNNKVSINTKTGLFKGLPDEIIAYEHHSRYLKNVPNELEIAASSKKDHVEAVFHKYRPIYGLQFHPEKSGTNGFKIFENFISICKNYRPAFRNT